MSENQRSNRLRSQLVETSRLQFHSLKGEICQIKVASAANKVTTGGGVLAPKLGPQNGLSRRIKDTWCHLFSGRALELTRSLQ